MEQQPNGQQNVHTGPARLEQDTGAFGVDIEHPDKISQTNDVSSDQNIEYPENTSKTLNDNPAYRQGTERNSEDNSSIDSQGGSSISLQDSTAAEVWQIRHQEFTWAPQSSRFSAGRGPEQIHMAGTKKYAGLPDLDDAGTELYQTPGLTDDASTVQTDTIQTESPTPSEDGANGNFDRTQFNREEARRRFEPAVVDAKEVNFSYAVGGNQKSYKSRNRRRRRVRRSDGVEEYGDISDTSDVDEKETLGQRLARLKREAEEIRLELEQRDKEDGEFKDSFEHQQGATENEDNDTDLSKGVEDLSQILNRLQTSTRPKTQTLEQEFSRQLEVGTLSRKQPTRTTGIVQTDISPTTISAISAFSDRLSAIETALGLSNISLSSTPTPILPTLDVLSNQINLLHSTISIRQPSTTTSQPADLAPQMPHLDILQSRLHTLHQSATSLINARKAAQTALTELETVRLRGIRAADHLARYQTLANRRNNRPTPASSSQPQAVEDEDASARPTSRGGGGGRRATVIEEAHERVDIADEIMTPLFLEEQADKIKALYTLLPTIQDLQPLLPVVLERLRGLSIVHANAAGARVEMDELEGRLRDWEGELGKWRVAVEGVEGGIEELKGVMKENVKVVGGMVRGVEERVERLDGR